MRTRKRVGSIVDCEHVDPHKGSLLAKGVIVGWADAGGRRTSRMLATRALVEVARSFSPWDEWGEDHAFVSAPFHDDDPFSADNIRARCPWLSRKEAAEREARAHGMEF